MRSGRRSKSVRPFLAEGSEFDLVAPSRPGLLGDPDVGRRHVIRRSRLFRIELRTHHFPNYRHVESAIESNVDHVHARFRIRLRKALRELAPTERTARVQRTPR